METVDLGYCICKGNQGKFDYKGPKGNLDTY